jgi:dihydrofolate reductase/thymidylate synthase
MIVFVGINKNVYIIYRKKMKEFKVIVAATSSNMAIGVNNTIPWSIPSDMANFKNLTSKTCDPHLKNAVIMGRNTWTSIPDKFKPLKGRFNIVVSRNPSLRADLSIPIEVAFAGSFEEALCIANQQENIENIFVIGGQALYAAAIASPLCYKIYFTEVFLDVPQADAFFPPLPPFRYTITYASEIEEENGVKFRFLTFSNT